MWLTSKRPARVLTATCSWRMPSYMIGISQPANGTSRALAASWRSKSGVRRAAFVSAVLTGLRRLSRAGACGGLRELLPGGELSPCAPLKDMTKSASSQQALSLLPARGFERRFVVARNPDLESSLPFLLRVPVGGGLTLKAAEPWPVSSRVYCHPVDEAPPAAGLEVLEEVGVRMCAWRGQAVDLVLDRAQHNRSQFVFTTAHGRPAIFWQTPLVTRRSRPPFRMPRGPRPGTGALTIEVDTREQRPYEFAGRSVSVARRALFAGDYAVRGVGGVVAAVERKTATDFATSACSGVLGFAMSDLSALPVSAVVVEERYSAVIAHAHVRPGWLADLIARLHVRAPNVAIVYAETRALAEDWTYRFLATAWRELGGDP